jgi:hypothetical protein
VAWALPGCSFERSARHRVAHLKYRGSLFRCRHGWWSRPSARPLMRWLRGEGTSCCPSVLLEEQLELEVADVLAVGSRGRRRGTPQASTQNLRSLRPAFAGVHPCSKRPAVTGFLVHGRSHQFTCVRRAWLPIWLPQRALPCLQLRGGVGAQVLANVREGEVDAAMADGLGERGEP